MNSTKTLPKNWPNKTTVGNRCSIDVITYKISSCTFRTNAAIFRIGLLKRIHNWTHAACVFSFGSIYIKINEPQIGSHTQKTTKKERCNFSCCCVLLLLVCVAHGFLFGWCPLIRRKQLQECINTFWSICSHSLVYCFELMLCCIHRTKVS